MFAFREGRRVLMTLLRTALAAFAIALAVPAVVHGADRFMVRDEPLSATSGLRARQAPLDFNLVGLHWKGPGSVSFRTLSRAGRWSSWREAAAEAEDLPDADSAEGAARRGWKLGSPYLDRAGDVDPVPVRRPRLEAPRVLRLERPPSGAGAYFPAASPPARRSRPSSAAPNGARTSRSCARGPTTPPRFALRSSTTPPGRTPTRLRNRRRSSGASSATTCSRTAGTTSATTSSSTNTARSSRAEAAGSRRTSSALTPRGSTQEAPASR